MFRSAMSQSCLLWHLGIALLLGAIPVHGPVAEAADDVPALEYNADIRPILADTCFNCHGPDSASRKADLRLDERQAAIDMGAILPGDAESSEMIRRILSDDPSEVMPPPELKKELTAEQKEKLVRWVNEGAEYQLHWAFLPPQQPELPSVKNEPWIRNPIDRFVLSKLEKNGMEPAPEADRRTLARRASLDLTGLPPDPAWVAEFLADNEPGAYERYVDRLLESVHWGEHRARYWLDYARYADTHGIHFDNYREMWSYRDWVIQAFNQNMPFDQFTIESLGGDLLPNASLDQKIGSGFNRCNMTTNEGGIIDEEYKVLYARDRTETTSLVWMGLTVGCAVCHNHKFDPISQQEFYELSAFFNNTTQPVRDGNVKDTPPVIRVPRDVDRARWQALPQLIEDAQQKVAARREAARADFAAWLASSTPDALGTAPSPDQLQVHVPLDQGSARTALARLADQTTRELPVADSAEWKADLGGRPSWYLNGAAVKLSDAGDFESDQAFSVAAWIYPPANDGFGAMVARMDNANAHRGWDFWIQRRQVGMHLINAWPDQALKVVAQAQVPADRWTHVAVTYDGSGKAAGVRVYYDGVPQELQVENDRLSGSTRTTVPLTVGQREQGDAYTGGLQDVRLYSGALTAAETSRLAGAGRIEALLAKSADARSEAETNELLEFWLANFDAPHQELTAALAQLQRERADIEARGTIAHVMQEAEGPAMAHVLFRGEYDQRREEVRASTPNVLPPYPDSLPRNRLGFAQWLLLPEHPLTARVTVNRCWQEVFGAGIVRTTGDFGVTGDLPSHPELLDWLALEFRDTGWDVKRLYKTIVMSATYRQSAAATPEKIERDPANRLLARGPRFRMDAEMVRDNALAVSGLLVETIGGPSVKPYQPPGVWEAIAMNVSNTRSYERDAGDSLYRRSLYTFVKRMAPPASLELFNSPNRELCVVQRERTNTPLQALVTLNDEQFIEAARHLAQRTLKEGGTTFDARIRFLAEHLLAREFRPDELEIVRTSLEDLGKFYGSHRDESIELLSVGESVADPTLDLSELASWTMLANQLLNLDEVLNK
jgi:hypothetical protein